MSARLTSTVRTVGGAIDRVAGALLLAILALLVAMTAVLASRKPLWNDELFTYYISGLPNAGDMWSTLATGVEQTPISFYIVTRACLEVFGNGLVAIRLPEMLGYLLMCVCVYSFVVRRARPLYALVAVLFPITTIAQGYAYEARAYGLVLGFSAAALFCWQLTTEAGPQRRLYALGTFASLAAAVGSHYYAVLVVVPLLAGEAARSLGRRRVDWLVLASFFGAMVPLVLSAPLIKEAQEYSTTFWSLPTWTSAVRFYPDSLLDRQLPLVLALVLSVSGLAAWRSSTQRAERTTWLRGLPKHELVALLALLLVPFFAVTLGKLATGAFTERSALPALVGATILIALAASWLDGGVPIAGVLLLVVLTVFAGSRLAARYHQATSDAQEQTQALRFLQRHSKPRLPIVIASPHDFFELSHRAAHGRGPRLTYLADPPAALNFLGTDAVEFGVVGMRHIAPLTVQSYRPFTAAHRHFLVYGRDRPWDWLTQALDAQSAREQVVARDPENGAELVDVRVDG